MLAQVLYCSTILYICVSIACCLPVPDREKMMWDNPCGAKLDVSDDYVDHDYGYIENKTEVQISTFRTIKFELENAIDEIESDNVNNLYSRIKDEITLNNFYTNWIPEVDTTVTKISLLNISTYPNQLAKLSIDLQKFAVAFEQVKADENSPKESKVLSNFYNYLKVLLCEVEMSIYSLGEPIPVAITRDIMPISSRSVTDETARLLRDYEIFLKYKKFLNVWYDILS